MPHYIALIHKDAESGYDVSFPDLPGVTTAANSIDEAMSMASEDWRELTGRAFPQATTN